MIWGTDRGSSFCCKLHQEGPQVLMLRPKLYEIIVSIYRPQLKILQIFQLIASHTAVSTRFPQARV